MNLKDRWARHCVAGHVDWTWAMLVALYGSPGRHYHTLEHIDRCMGLLDTVKANIDRVCAELALFWHDAVYVVGAEAGQNEWQSAELLRVLEPSLVTSHKLAQIAIRSTSFHDIVNPHSTAAATIAAVLDVDMSILGSNSTFYGQYVNRLRLEYQHVPQAQWAAGRADFLRKTLARPIFSLPEMREQLEGRARANMEAELSAMGFARLDPEGTARGKTILTAPIVGSDEGTRYAGPATSHIDTETGKRTKIR